MAQAKLNNYLKSYRRKAGFSQRELAYLLGCDDGTRISRYERHARQPDTQTLLAYRVVFGASVTELLRGHYEKVEAETRQRARTLIQKLEKKGELDPMEAHKIQILDELSEPLPLIYNHEH